MKHACNWERKGAPLLLVDQLIAWRGYMGGDTVHQISFDIRRPVTEARVILFGRSA